MDLTESLGMVEFDIKLDSKGWSLYSIFKFLKKAKKEIKWSYPTDWKEVGFVCNQETNEVLCETHYVNLIADEDIAKHLFVPIETILAEIKSNSIIFEKTFIKCKAAIAIFNSSQNKIKNKDQAIENLKRYEYKLNQYSIKIMKYVKGGTYNSNIYETLNLMKADLKNYLELIPNIYSICKTGFFSVFFDSMVEKLQEISILESSDRSEYNPEVDEVNPIFNK